MKPAKLLIQLPARLVLAALNRIRAEQHAFPDLRVAIQRELSLIEARSRRLLDLDG